MRFTLCVYNCEWVAVGEPVGKEFADSEPVSERVTLALRLTRQSDRVLNRLGLAVDEQLRHDIRDSDRNYCGRHEVV